MDTYRDYVGRSANEGTQSKSVCEAVPTAPDDRSRNVGVGDALKQS